MRYVTKTRLWLLWTICGALAFHGKTSYATLGEDSREIEKTKIAFRVAHHQTLDRGNFTVSQFTNGKITVREYAAPNGKVFAVSWTGRGNHPDLTSLLGTYFEDFRSAAQPRSHLIRGRFSSVAGNQVTVEKAGHFGGEMNGRAFVWELIPTGVNLYEIK